MKEEFIYLCKIKGLGNRFCVFEEDVAKRWAQEEPEAYSYEKVSIKSREDTERLILRNIGARWTDEQN